MNDYYLCCNIMNTIESIYQLYLNCQQNICTDTRKIATNSLFFALKGDNFNGNLYSIKALELGAKYAIVDEKTDSDERLIIVDDVLKTLQLLANYHRKQCKAIILGIAGSNGKTTTKELISAILQTEKNIHFTHGNLNNHIGVPLTLLRIKPEHEIAVIELGANHIGDIKELCKIAEPNMGLITNIGKEHLEGFGSIEGVAEAEGELYDFLVQNNGLAFINMDDLWLVKMSDEIENKIAYSYLTKNANIFISKIQVVPNLIFNYSEIEMESPLMGEHNLQNITAAIAIGIYFNIDASNISKAIKSYAPSNNRSQIIQTDKKNTILLDAYNANPSSVQEALKTFSQMSINPKYVILGDMFELGKYAEAEHQSILELCQNLEIENCILVGNEFYKTQKGSESTLKFLDKNEAMNYFKEKEIKNSGILIKGSRGMKMEDFKDLF